MAATQRAISLESKSPNSKLKCNYSVIALLILCLIYVAEGLNCTIFLPFFPPHALHLGLTPTQVGMVHGMYDVSTLISQFIIGTLITPATAKQFCFLGTCISAVGLVLFGYTGEEERPHWFFSLCILIRVVMGLGASMVYACVIPLADSLFPGNMAVINSIAQSCLGFGFICGPPLGSALHSLGSAVGFEEYMTPFMVIGVLEFLLALLFLAFYPNKLVYDCKLPKQQYPGVPHLKFYTTAKILMIAIPSVIFYCLFGFQDVTLAPYIQKATGLKEDKVGYVYLWLTVSYIGSAIGSGFLIKKGYGGLVLMFAMYGTAFGTFAYYPTQKLPRLESLITIFATLLMNGTSMAALFGSLYLILEKLAEQSGFLNYHVNKLLVAQLISIIRSTGKIIGASFFGGLLLQKSSFQEASFIFAVTEFIMALFVTSLLLHWEFLAKTFYTPKKRNSPSYLRLESRESSCLL